MFDWLIRKKQMKKMKAEKEEERLSTLKRAEEQHKEDLKKITEWEGQMVSKPCPLNGGENCFKNCVHFQKGKSSKPDVMYSNFQRPHMWIVWMDKPTHPQCKLWGIKGD